MDVFFDWRWRIIKKYDIWSKVNNDTYIKKLDSDPILNKKILKTKICYGDEATDFHDGEMQKVGFNYICLGVIWLNLVLKKDENYYPQVFLEECKYIEKEKVETYISDDL